jgi:hypothetical protein
MKVKQNDMAVLNSMGESDYRVLNPLTRKMHKINETGKFIWEACAEAVDTDVLASKVAEHFHIPVDIAQKDVERFVQNMLDFELFEEV